eukprot:4770958-Pyramimonas_sp.AAC.1
MSAFTYGVSCHISGFFVVARARRILDIICRSLLSARRAGQGRDRDARWGDHGQMCDKPRQSQ